MQPESRAVEGQKSPIDNALDVMDSRLCEQDEVITHLRQTVESITVESPQTEAARPTADNPGQSNMTRRLWGIATSIERITGDLTGLIQSLEL